jgi:hypothetical protein
MKTAEEIFKEIKEMDSTEVCKLVRDVLQFSKKPGDEQSELLIKLIEEFTKVKQDIEFLSRKIGVT